MAWVTGATRTPSPNLPTRGRADSSSRASTSSRPSDRGDRPGLVQGSQAAQGALDDACGVLLLQRHPGHVVRRDEGVQEAASPGREIVPGRSVGDRGEPFRQLSHELAQRDCRVSIAFGPGDRGLVRLVLLLLGLDGRRLRLDVGREPRVPVLAGDHPRLARYPLPARDADPLAGEVARADLSQRPEHVGPPEAGAACLEQSEHQPGHRPLVDRADAGAVDRDARRTEVLVKQTRVWRPVGIQDGDAVSGHRLQRLDHLAYDAAHLVVGVGGVQDTGGERLGGAGGGLEPGREGGQRGDDALVGAGVAGEPGDDLQVGRSARDWANAVSARVRSCGR